MTTAKKHTSDSSQVRDLKKMVAQLLQKIDELEKRVVKTEEENIRLIDKSIDQDSLIDKLQTENKELSIRLKNSEKRVVSLDKENQSLHNKMHRKNSRNSSIPPSKDENRPSKNYSLRTKSGKKVGGQKGHKGAFLKFSDKPNEVIKHLPKACQNCGQKLLSKPQLALKKQIIDIPPIVPVITEHQFYKQKCSCGHCTTATLPKVLQNVKTNVVYGTNVQALITYFNVRQYVPIERMKEMFDQVFGLKITTGTICNKLEKAADKLLPLYDWIRKQILQSHCNGSDETGCRVNQNKGWFWTWQNPLFTYLAYSDNRGFDTIKKHFPQGLPNSILVHDCYAAQFKIKCKGHQICTAHLLRELNFFIEKGDKWSKRFKEQICKALKLHKKIIAKPKSNFNKQINQINRAVDQLLLNIEKSDDKIYAFKKRMKKRREAILRFLKDPSIPPDNNGSERAIRNVKVKTKVSGMFKSHQGARYFAVNRSVIDTFIKRGQPVLFALNKALQ